jgi:hypothetical protein
MTEGRENRPVPSREDRAMAALLTHEGTQPTTTEPTAPTGRGRLRGAWHRIHMTVQEMNYAARRVVELQAPWSVDQQWKSR